METVIYVINQLKSIKNKKGSLPKPDDSLFMIYQLLNIFLLNIVFPISQSKVLKLFTLFIFLSFFFLSHFRLKLVENNAVRAINLHFLAIHDNHSLLNIHMEEG